MATFKKIYLETKAEGGVADNLTVGDIAKKHNVEASVIEDQLQKGIKVEMEHSDDKELAKDIALDHLFELPDYYDRLEKMEK